MYPIIQGTRNTFPSIVFVLSILSGLVIRKKASFISVFSVFFSFSLVIGGYTGAFVRGFTDEKFFEEVAYVERFYSDNVVILRDNSRWENTIASKWGTPDIYALSAPAGAGWNLHFNNSDKVINEKYLIMPINIQEEIDLYKTHGWEVIYTNDEVILLLNPKYQ